MTALTPDLLTEIWSRANLQCGLDGDDADDLLIHVDHLTAENARLRAGIEAISSVSWDVVHPSWVKHMCRDLLNPPTEGEVEP